MKSKEYKRIALSLVAITISLLLITGCKKDDSPSLPKDVVLSFPENGAVDVLLNSSLSWETVENSNQITYDVYFGTDASSLTPVSKDQVSTTCSIDLASKSTYFWKVVAKNKTGRSIESPIWSFSTEMIHWGDDSFGVFVDPRDNHEYKIVKIGEQIWFAENLAYLPSISGPTPGSVTSPYYYVYDYNGTSISEAKATNNYQIYGVLYNLPAAKISCPDGWHLPSDEEWTTLTDYLTNNGYGYQDNGDDIAKSIAANSGWATDQTGGTAGTDQTSNNTTGFTARPGGCRSWEKAFFQIGKTGYWWSSTPTNPPSDAYLGRVLNYEYSALDRQGLIENSGYSIRCLLD